MNTGISPWTNEFFQFMKIQHGDFSRKLWFWERFDHESTGGVKSVLKRKTYNG
jgi:hypothetical protein